ncbi:MAG: alanine racemase [Clostridia bacterium]|nr:alanine racemase [Clostridia bacterium]
MTLNEAKARCWAEIDLSALKSNYQNAMEILGGEAKLICVLKANAYGLGAKKVARTLRGLGARSFAVACLAEAEEIRSVVPDADVLVMGLLSEEEAERACRQGIEMTVWNAASAKMVRELYAKTGVKPRVHLKLDTGLHRLGFGENDFDEMLDFALHAPIQLAGLYTHLALRDRENDLKQFALFDRADALLKARGLDGYLRHACDSIGMVRYPERHMDAVRAGAWLYGVCPNRYEHPERDRLTVRFMTRISDIHTVPAGECIGYDEEHPLQRESRVATLSAGYVDGFPRLNNVGAVVVQGRRAPVLGLVCMDQMMVDVTDIPACEVGDEVTMLGDGMGLNEYAQIAKMNRNECLSRLGRRVPKIYMEDGQITEIIREM